MSTIFPQPASYIDIHLYYLNIHLKKPERVGKLTSEPVNLSDHKINRKRVEQ